MMNKVIKRGDIYMVDLGSNKGSVQGGIRPVVIMSNNLNNKYSPTVNVFPVTSQTKNSIPVHVDIGVECGLTKNSTILVEQGITIDKNQLKKYVGRCDNYKMDEIENAILIQLGVNQKRELVRVG